MAGDGDGIGIFCTGVWDLLYGGQDWGMGVKKAGNPPSSSRLEEMIFYFVKANIY